MTRKRLSGSDLLAGPAVWISFALLVFPLATSVVDGRLWTPIAFPGYTIFVLITVIGDVLPVVRNFGFRLYWVPFVSICYGISVVIATGYYTIRKQYATSSSPE
jgi:hypothetical protein